MRVNQNILQKSTFSWVNPDLSKQNLWKTSMQEFSWFKSTLIQGQEDSAKIWIVTFDAYFSSCQGSSEIFIIAEWKLWWVYNVNDKFWMHYGADRNFSFFLKNFYYAPWHQKNFKVYEILSIRLRVNLFPDWFNQTNL